MNKSYKLIKEYPGSPKLGSEQTFNQGWNTYLSKYSEFWEEIIEKEYEILSFKTGVNIRTLSQQNGLYYFQSDGKDLKYLINNKFYNIHSVKRLSDGEVFTVGDIVNPKYSDTFTYTLTYIKIINNTIRVSGEHKKDNNLVRAMGNYPLEDIVKTKQPLFTTEDGVDIFKNQNYFTVNKIDYSTRLYGGFNMPQYTQKDFNFWNLLTFSTKAKAEEYIIMNKPILSVNDCRNLYNKFMCIKDKSFTDTLKELAKQKVGL